VRVCVCSNIEWCLRLRGVSRAYVMDECDGTRCTQAVGDELCVCVCG